MKKSSFLRIKHINQSFSQAKDTINQITAAKDAINQTTGISRYQPDHKR